MKQTLKQFVKKEFDDAEKNELGWAKDIDKENFNPLSFEVLMTSRWRAKKMAIHNILMEIERREKK